MRGLLLDTHVWIWLMEGSLELGHKQQKTINEAAQLGVVGIAAISVWEVAMLVEKKRIKLEKPLLAWVQEALALPGVELKPLTPEIAVESSQLPDGFHGDPADRLIVATARMHQLTLLTHDQKILDYAKKEYLSTIAA
jgi:PIN domain nuclease of toxin-antitoxin system